MAYIGASGALTNQATASDVFNGNGSNTTFTLSRTVFNTRDIEVVVNNVQQNPFDGSYSVSGQTLTFSGAPASGANNIYVNYQAGVIGGVAPTDNSVTANSIQTGAVTSAKLALTTLAAGNTTLTGSLSVSNTSTHTGAATFSNTVTVANSGITFGDASTQTTAASGFGFKNRIINGDMRIDQRYGGSAVVATDPNAFCLDRWFMAFSVNGKYNVQQTPSATEPGYATRVAAGFTNYMAVTSLAATSVGANENYDVRQRIEGLNTADLAWGTSGAQAVTLSFWVSSTLTGTFGGAIKNGAADYSFPFSYTITAANTWEKKTITIPGPTAGTWVTTNGIGVQVQFSLGSGSSYLGSANTWANANYIAATGAGSVVGTSGAVWRLTGVQLEKSPSATNFDFLDYTTQVILCQRYYEVAQWVASSYYNGSNGLGLLIPQKVIKRATPTITRTSDNWGGWNVNVGNYNEGADTLIVYCNVTGSATGFVRVSSIIIMSAELT